MSTPFSPDYAAARQRFRQSASRLGWQLEALPVGLNGPACDELTLDVAVSAGGDPERVLIVSSGLHGVEGFFGSAVQVAVLEAWAGQPPPPARCVFLHALNPYCFAWRRRFDENNVDPNRNFLLEGQRFEGAPEGYTTLDPLLNPRRPPSRWEPFLLKAAWAIARYGMPALRQTIAGGQYAFPRGLFFGGAGPSRTHLMLAANLGRWLHGSRSVVHLDFHTGLGAWGTWKLLIDYPLRDDQQAWLTEWFGPDSFEPCDTAGIAFDARGGVGMWCVNGGLAPDYLFACAEFGTYGPVAVLAGLRAENQAHHWGAPGDAATERAKRRLVELFCPADEAWRSQVVTRGVDLVNRAVRGLVEREE